MRILAKCVVVAAAVGLAVGRAGAQDVAGIGEVFGTLVSPTSVEPAPVPEPGLQAEEVQRAARAMRAAAARLAAARPQDATTLDEAAVDLESETIADLVKLDKATTSLRSVSTNLEPDEAAALEAVAALLDEQKAGWYLAADAPIGQVQISLKKVLKATPETIEEGLLLALAPNEPLYRVVHVAANGTDVTIKPATRHAYTAANKVAVAISAEKLVWLSSLGFRDVEDRFSTSVGFGASYARYELSAGYANTDARGGGADVENRSLKAKALLRPRLYSNFNNKASLVVDASKVPHIRERQRALLSGNFGIDGFRCKFNCRTNLVANVGWAKDDFKTDTPDVDDWVGGIGVSHDFRPSIVMAVEYSFENDLDGEDSASGTLTKKFADTRLTFGAAKHGTLFATFFASF